jgi:hypothetical protein
LASSAVATELLHYVDSWRAMGGGAAERDFECQRRSRVRDLSLSTARHRFLFQRERNQLLAGGTFQAGAQTYCPTKYPSRVCTIRSFCFVVSWIL